MRNKLKIFFKRILPANSYVRNGIAGGRVGGVLSNI